MKTKLLKPRLLFISIALCTLLILLLIIFPSGEGVYNNENALATVTPSATEGTTTYQPLIIMCQRQGKCIYTDPSDNYDMSGKTLLEYSDNYACYEWYLVNEGNDQYSIHYFNSPSGKDYILTYDSNNVICVVNTPSTLENKHKWTFDYATGETIIGATEATKIKNVANELYLFGKDDGGLIFSSSSEPYADARTWKITLSQREDQNELTAFRVNYANWISVDGTSQLTVTTVPSSAFKATFPNDFNIEIANTSIAELEDTVIIGKSVGSTFIDISHKYSELSYRLPITVGQVLTNGEYYISNRASMKFLTGPSASLLGETEFAEGNSQIWIINHVGDGYYTIKSKAYNLYVGLSSPMGISGVGISLQSAVSDSTKWKIIPTTQGGYAIISKYGENFKYALYGIGSSSTPSSIQQYIYKDNCEYYDEWYIQLNSQNSMYVNDIGITAGGQYNILNVKNDTFLHIGYDNSPTLIPILVTQSSYCCENMTFCVETYTTLEDGTKNYRIYSPELPNYYLDDSSTSVYATQNSTQTWQIIRAKFKPYQGTYLIKCNDYYLGMNSSNVVLKTTIDSSCFWSFTLANTFSVNYFYFSEFSSNSLASLSNDFKFMPNSFNPELDSSAMQAYNLMPSSHIFIFRGHANAGTLKFYNSRLRAYGSSSGNYYSIGTHASNALSSLQIAFLQGCSTGVKYQNYPTLQDITFEKGAHFALGTYDTVHTHHGHCFLEMAMDSYSRGDSIQDSLNNAQAEIAKVYGETVYLPTYALYQDFYPIIYTGDIYQKNLFGGKINETE